jgi:hypothetical protein
MDTTTDLFQTNPESLKSLLAEAETGTLALPEFQRDFIWPTEYTASLLSSIIADYPAGSILAWRPKKVELQARELAGAPRLEGNPDRLILDGQQRLTALYRSLNEGKAEETYFIRLAELLDEETYGLKPTDSVNWDSVIEVKTLTAAERRARKRNPPKDPAHRLTDWQYDNRCYPVWDKNFEEWSDGLIERVDPSERKVFQSALRQIRRRYIEKLENYKFPVVTLTDAATLSAVCRVFEKLNTKSVGLGPFAILTAKFYKDGISLREKWDEAKAKYDALRDPSELNDYRGFSIDPYTILQIVSLISNGSPQRKAVLEDLSAADVHKHWERVVSSLNQVIEELQENCGIAHRDLLPYQAVLVPLTGAWIEMESLAPEEMDQALVKIRQYFWASIFTTNFDQGAASQAQKDYKDLNNWIRNILDGGKPIKPEVIDDLQITADSILSATGKKKALLNGVLALTATLGAEELFSGVRLSPITYVDSRIQPHQLFPKACLENGEVVSGNFSPDLILNRALIGADANKKILASSKPSVYAESMADSSFQVDRILASHLVDPVAFRGDDYPAFIKSRLAAVCEKIEFVTGKKVDPPTVEEGGAADDQPAI